MGSSELKTNKVEKLITSIPNHNDKKQGTEDVELISSFGTPNNQSQSFISDLPIFKDLQT